ncbi:TonB-dependent siderophore receptor [Pelomicrobium sp. G1]|uniref:TonB-dependent siderophore receptor n=1 Tax=unclassified Pelomicrobium TaxID=2815318 RepID=UPI003F778250
MVSIALACAAQGYRWSRAPLVLSLALAFWPGSAAAQAAEVAQPNPGEGEAMLEEVTVKAPGPERFTVDHAPGVTRSLVPLQDLPASVKVIPRAVIEEQQALRLDQAVKNVSGVVFVDGGEGTTFSSRGFGLTTLRDGFRRTEFTEGDLNRADQDTYNVERVEVLKGPASVLFGRSNAGGIVNIVTKRPLPVPVAAVTLNAGSFDLYRATVDLGGALSPEGGFAARLNAGLEDAESFRDLVESRRKLAAPALAWRPDAQTTLTLLGEFVTVEETPDVGVPRQGNGVVPGVPLDRFLGEPSTDFLRSEVREGRLLFERGMGEWSLKGALLRATIENDEFFTRGASLQADGRTLNRSIIVSGFRSDDVMGQVEVAKKLSLAGKDHHVTLGIDAGQRETDSRFSSAPANPIDIFEPVYGNTGATGSFFVFRQTLKQDLLGAFAHDVISLAPRWKLALGLRYDRFKQEPLPGNPQALPTRTFERFSPRAGLVYQPTKAVSGYLVYDRSFQVPNGFPLRFDGQPLEPQRGILHEAGVKILWWENALSTTAAVYRIERTNVGTRDLDHPGFQIAVGEQRSQGFEFDVAGELATGWKLIGGYAYTEAEVIRDNSVPAGKTLPGVPRHAASLWASYQQPQGPWRGLGFGLGLQYLSERQGDLNNTFQVPAFARLDAAIFYKSRHWTARLNIYNVADRDILLNPTRSGFFRPDAPRTFLATVELRL